jgi:hypothetical protein
MKPPLLPSIDEALLLNHESPAFFDFFDELECLTVRAINQAVLMEKNVLSQAPVQLGASGVLTFPEIGLTLSLNQCLAAYANFRNQPEPLILMELDLPSQPVGLSFLAKANSPTGIALTDWMRAWSMNAVRKDWLENQRKKLVPRMQLCKHCLEAASRRAKNPQSNAIYRVLEHAARASLPLRFRLINRHLDLTGQMTPGQLSTHQSWICAADGETSFNVNTFFVPELRVYPDRLDGEIYTCLSGHNPKGVRVFEISTAADVSAEWHSICRRAVNG